MFFWYFIGYGYAVYHVDLDMFKANKESYEITCVKKRLTSV